RWQVVGRRHRRHDPSEQDQPTESNDQPGEDAREDAGDRRLREARCFDVRPSPSTPNDHGGGIPTSAPLASCSWTACHPETRQTGGMSEEGSPNRLIGEASPYLLQHANNPVDWYPWGPEALERARDEDKPILLSIGYAACHWCHVMEHESFEDPETAVKMNEHFVSIKVDREE